MSVVGGEYAVLRTLTALGLAFAVQAAPAAAQSPSRAEIEQVVRDLLEAEPELVVEAIRAFQAEQEERRNARVADALAANRDALVSDAHPRLGPADADIAVVEFFDYRCSFCRRMVPRLDALLENHDDVRVVLIEFPVLGPDSLRAAQASLAVWMQDRGVYPEVHRALMAADDLSAPALVALAEDHGLDGDRLVADMQGEAVRERLMANHELARALGVEGTPAFVVGDAFMPGAVPLERLEAAIAEARN
jgi:protein-disulfide isomerase